MQIKKYHGQTLKEATANMKDELGNDAVILGTRIIEEPDMDGIERMFEITAGYDKPSNIKKSIGDNSVKKQILQNTYSNELEELSKKIFAKNKSKNEKSDFSDKPKLNTKSKANKSNNIELHVKEVVDVLIHREIQKPIISNLLNQLKQYKSFLHETNIDNYVLSGISSMIPTYSFNVDNRNRTKIVALVGPTGVGKTTCIAKLAVISKILHNLDVGLISIDTYRLGAIDQLRIFSEVSNIDLKVAYEPQEMPKIINSFKKKDIIFIDTVGRSQKNIEQLRKTKEFLDASNVDESYLVLNSISTTKNLFDVAEKFKMLDYKSFIFSKIDEAVSFGNILNVVSNFNIPISFMTNGQVIPDDIISADSDFIANMIYTGKIEQ